MTADQVRLLRAITLLFLLPGMAGLFVSAGISTHYLQTLPKRPDVQQQRMYPREIHGTVVYQSAEEDTKLTRIETGSVGLFLVGVGFGLVYMEKWGIESAIASVDEDEFMEEAA